LKIYKI